MRQVRRVTARRVMWSSGCFGWGLAGEVRLGEMRWVLAWSDEVGLGLAGKVGRVDFGFGAVR